MACRNQGVRRAGSPERRLAEAIRVATTRFKGCGPFNHVARMLGVDRRTVKGDAHLPPPAHGVAPRLSATTCTSGRNAPPVDAARPLLSPKGSPRLRHGWTASRENSPDFALGPVGMFATLSGGIQRPRDRLWASATASLRANRDQ